MSTIEGVHQPTCHASDVDAIELTIEARPRDLGGFEVRRVLPSMRRRLVGPFIFFDQMGPAVLPMGQGMDVRPHPHIGLATVTFLFDGEIDHRDSLGTMRTIRPGDLNWMLAGRGIVHSERSSPESRRAGVRLHGIQSWVALPTDREEDEPRFEHHPRASLPAIQMPGVRLEVILGSAYDRQSPAGILSPTLYVHARIEAGGRLPIDPTYEDRAVYVVEGAIECCGRTVEAGTMVVLEPKADASALALSAARVMLLGGAKLAGERHIEWNFVSSSKERLERAKQDWRSERFPLVPGDERERIPLPG